MLVLSLVYVKLLVDLIIQKLPTTWSLCLTSNLVMLYFGNLLKFYFIYRLINTFPIFRHCDQVHAVEAKNEADVDSSVLYIPSVPMCRINSEYQKKQRDAFERGL